MKNDPRYVAAARELRDRWLEKVAAETGLIAPAPAPAPGSEGKYDVSRQIGSNEIVMSGAGVRMLDAA